MSNSTITYDPIVQSQASKEVTANGFFDAVSPASLFGRRASTTPSGLTWGYYGGTILVDGVLTQIANGTLGLTDSATNYVEINRSGTISKNTTGFTPGSVPLYTIVCAGGVVTSYLDYRAWVQPAGVAQHGAIVMATDANKTLTQAQAVCNVLSITSSVSLTVTRDIVVPLAPQQWTVFNNTTGAQSLRFIGASGTGITVANGKRAIIYSDGTNVVRITADV